MLGSMLVNVLLGVAGLSDDLCTSSGCRTGRGLGPHLVVATTLVAVLGMARLLGPVYVSPAVGSWLLAAPVDRATLLRPRLWWPLLVAAVLAAATAAGAATLGGLGAGPVTVTTLVSAGLAVAAVGVAVRSQADSRTVARMLTWLVAVLVWATLLTLVLDAAPVFKPPTRAGPGLWVLAAAVLLLAVLATLAARSRLPAMRRRSLATGGTLAPGLSGALATLDLALLYDVLLGARWQRVGAVRARRGGPGGLLAMGYADLVRLRRAPQVLVVLAGLVVTPYAVHTVGGGRLTVLVAALGGFLAGLPLLSALRVLTRSPGMIRSLPFGVARTRAATLVVPGVLLVAFGGAVAPALHAALDGPVSVAVALGPTVGLISLAAAVRWVTGRPPDYARPLVSSPAGAVPTNLYGSALRGFDILLLTAAPVLFAPGLGGALASAALSVGVLSYLVARD